MLIFQVQVARGMFDSSLFNEVSPSVMGNYWKDKPEWRANLANTFQNLLNYPRNSDGSYFPRRVYNVAKEDAEKYFLQMRDNWNALLGGKFVQMYYSKNSPDDVQRLGLDPNLYTVKFVINPSRTAADITAAYAKLASKSARKELLKNVKPVNKITMNTVPGVDTEAQQRAEEEERQLAAKRAEEELRKERENAEQNKVERPVPIETPVPKQAGWQSDPNNEGIARRIQPVNVEASEKSSEGSIYLARMPVPLDAAEEYDRSLGNFFEKNVRPTLIAFNVPKNLRIVGRASEERLLYEFLIQSRSTERYKTEFYRQFRNTLDAKLEDAYGVSIKQLGAMPADARFALLTTKGTVFKLDDSEQARLRGVLKSKFGLTNADAEYMLDFEVHRYNNIVGQALFRESVSERRILKTAWLADYIKDLKKSKDWGLDIDAALNGEPQGKLALEVGNDIPPGCGPDGVERYHEGLREHAARVRASEADRNTNLQGGKPTVFKELVKKGIFVFDEEAQSYTLSPDEDMVRTYREIIKIRPTINSPGEKYDPVDDGFKPDRLVNVDLVQSAQATVTPRFNKVPLAQGEPQNTVDTGFKFNFKFNFKLPQGMDVTYFNKNAKVKIYLNRIESGPDGREQAVRVIAYPYRAETKDGKTKAPANPDMKKDNAEAEITTYLPSKSNEGWVSVTPPQGKFLEPGLYRVSIMLDVKGQKQSPIGEYQVMLRSGEAPVIVEPEKTNSPSSGYGNHEFSFTPVVVGKGAAKKIVMNDEENGVRSSGFVFLQLEAALPVSKRRVLDQEENGAPMAFYDIAKGQIGIYAIYHDPDEEKYYLINPQDKRSPGIPLTAGKKVLYLDFDGNAASFCPRNWKGPRRVTLVEYALNEDGEPKYSSARTSDKGSWGDKFLKQSGIVQLYQQAEDETTFYMKRLSDGKRVDKVSFFAPSSGHVGMVEKYYGSTAKR